MPTNVPGKKLSYFPQNPSAVGDKIPALRGPLNIKYDAQAFAEYAGNQAKAIDTDLLRVGMKQALSEAKEGYTIIGFVGVNDSGAGALAYHVTTDPDTTQATGKMVYTNQYTGNAFTTSWVSFDGIRTAQRFPTDPPKDFLQDEQIVARINGVDEFFLARYDLLRSDFPGGTIPYPTGADNDPHWSFASASAAFIGYQRLTRPAALAASNNEDVYPGRAYLIFSDTEQKGIITTGTFDGVTFSPVALREDGNGAYTIGTYNLDADEFVAGAGGGGAPFASDFLVVTAPLGKYNIGQTVPAAGKTSNEVLLDAYSGVLRPTYTPAQIFVSKSIADVGEIGESVTPDITGTFQQNDAGALASLRVYKVVSASPTQLGAQSTTSPVTRSTTMVRTATPIGFYAVADYAQGARKNNVGTNTPDDRAYAVRSTAAPQAAETGFQSQVTYLSGYYRIFYGTGSATTSAQVRALGDSQLTNAGNSFILNTGTSATDFTVWVPNTLKIDVLDLDAFNAAMPYAFTALSVNDAGGTPVAGKLYKLTLASAYAVNHRHQVTVSPA